MPHSPFFIGTRTTRERATRLGVARIAVGGLTFQPMALGRRLMGVSDAEAGGALVFFARAFGVRNMVLGAWVLATRDQSRETRQLVYRVNAAVDAADMLVLLWAALANNIPKRLFALAAGLGGNACYAFFELASEV